jgi:hypothetical protein
MNKDLVKLIGLGLTIYGVAAAASNFSTSLTRVEKTGLTLSSGVALFIAGYILIGRIEDTANLL